MKHYLAPILAIFTVTVASCSTGETVWKSSFGEEEVRTAIFEASNDISDCEADQWGDSITSDVQTQCDQDVETLRLSFKFELIECNNSVPAQVGLSGPDLRSAEVCLVSYQREPHPRHVRRSKLLGTAPVMPEEQRASWVIYRLDGVPTAHKRL